MKEGVWTQTGYYAPSFASGVSGAIITLLNILLFFGALMGKRTLYLPWLTIKMIGIIGAYIFAGCLLFMGNLICMPIYRFQ